MAFVKIFTPQKIFPPEKYSLLKNIPPRKIFIPEKYSSLKISRLEKYSPMKNILNQLLKIFAPEKYSLLKNIHP